MNTAMVTIQLSRTLCNFIALHVTNLCTLESRSLLGRMMVRRSGLYQRLPIFEQKSTLALHGRYTVTIAALIESNIFVLNLDVFMSVVFEDWLMYGPRSTSPPIPAEVQQHVNILYVFDLAAQDCRGNTNINDSRIAISLLNLHVLSDISSLYWLSSIVEVVYVVDIVVLPTSRHLPLDVVISQSSSKVIHRSTSQPIRALCDSSTLCQAHQLLVTATLLRTAKYGRPAIQLDMPGNL